MKTKISSKISHIIITDTKTTLISSKKFLDFSVWFNKLNAQNMEYFFTSNNLQKFIGEYFSEKIIHFENSKYFFHSNFICFIDIYSFFEFYKNQEKLNFSYILVIIQSKFFIFHKKYISDFARIILSNINYQIYNNLYNFFHSQNSDIFYEFSFYKKQKNKILKFFAQKCDILENIKNNFIAEFNGKDCIYYKKINYNERVDFLPKIFLNENYRNSQNLSAKIDFWFWKPVSSVYKFVKKIQNGNIWKWFGSIYGLCENNLIFYYDNLNSATGFDLSNSWLAKIKSFAEWIERYNSWYFYNDCQYKKFLNTEDFERIVKIIWYDFEKNKENQYFWNYVFEIIPDWENIFLWNNPIFLPNNLLHYPILWDNFYYANSSWIACWRTYEEALIAWLLELCERDSLMTLWLLKLTPNIIKYETLPLKIKNKIQKIENLANGKITIFDISFDKNFPHIFVFFKYNDSKNELIHVWASANFDLDNAILKSLDEIFVNIVYWANKIKNISDFSDITTVSDHRFFYCQKWNIQFLDFLFTDNDYVDYKILRNKFYKNFSLWGFIDYLMKNIWWKFYFYNLTTKYSHSLWLYVVRILSENLVPIWFTYYENPPLQKSRLQNSFFQKFQKNKYLHNIPDFLHFFD